MRFFDEGDQNCKMCRKLLFNEDVHMHYCKSCNTMKDESEFSRERTGRLKNYCKPCCVKRTTECHKLKKQGLRRCRICGEAKDIDDFPKRKLTCSSCLESKEKQLLREIKQSQMHPKNRRKTVADIRAESLYQMLLENNFVARMDFAESGWDMDKVLSKIQKKYNVKVNQIYKDKFKYYSLKYDRYYTDKEISKIRKIGRYTFEYDEGCRKYKHPITGHVIFSNNLLRRVVIEAKMGKL